MTTGRSGRCVRRAAAALLVVASGLAAAAVEPPPAGAIDHDKGYAGFCRTSTGVTVVVDFQQLGGTTYVRCFPQAARGTGLDALKGAGFQIEGVRRWGESFICRIENRPSAVEVLDVDGNPDHREQCIDTPPAGAFWSYWSAGNNCRWSYSQWGVKNRDFVQGGFEGWSFSLNAGADSNPMPRIAPVRPGTEGGSCSTTPEPAPTSSDPNQGQTPSGAGATAGGSSTGSGASGGTDADASNDGSSGGGAGDDASGAGSEGTSSAEDPDLPLPKPRTQSSAPDEAVVASAQVDQDPGDNVAFSGGAEARDIREVIREQQGGQWWAPWLAGLAVVAIGVGIWWTSRRRRLLREG